MVLCGMLDCSENALLINFVSWYPTPIQLVLWLAFKGSVLMLLSLSQYFNNSIYDKIHWIQADSATDENKILFTITGSTGSALHSLVWRTCRFIPTSSVNLVTQPTHLPSHLSTSCLPFWLSRSPPPDRSSGENTVGQIKWLSVWPSPAFIILTQTVRNFDFMFAVFVKIIKCLQGFLRCGQTRF